MATSQAEVLPIVLEGRDNTRKAFDSLRGSVSEIKRTLGGLSSGVGFLTGGAGGLIAALGVDKIVSELAAAHREMVSIGDTAKRIAMPVGDFQAISAAIRQTGTDQATVNNSLDAMSKLLNDARHNENSLTAILDANNVKWKQRNGDVISVNRGLEIAADLIRRAATEQDKIEIAKRLGLPAELIPALEKGAEAFRTAQTEARRLGLVIDAEVIRRAKELDQQWDQFTTRIEMRAKGGLFNQLATDALIRDKLALERSMDAAGSLPRYSRQRFQIAGGPGQLEVNRLRQEMVDAAYDERQRERARAGGDRFAGFSPPLAAPGNTTNIPGSKKDGSSSDRNDIDRVLNSIGKHISMMEADARAVGKTAGEHERLRTVLQLVDAAQREGLPITKDREEQFAKLGERARKAADDLAFLKLKSDIMFERDQMGRSDTEQTVAARLRGAQVDARSEQGRFLADQIRINEQLKLTHDIAGDALKGFIADLRQGKSAAEAFEGMLGRVLDKLLNLSLDSALKGLLGGGGGGNLLANLLGMGGGSGSAGYVNTDLGNGFGGAGVLTFHSGGIIGAGGGPRRLIHPSYFDNAPRFHRGGILGPDEMPIIGKVGEEVLTEGDPRHSRNGGAGGAKVEVHNYAAPGTSTEVKQRRENGVDIIEMIHSTVNDGMANGRYDQTQRARFGASVRSRGR